MFPFQRNVPSFKLRINLSGLFLCTAGVLPSQLAERTTSKKKSKSNNSRAAKKTHTECNFGYYEILIKSSAHFYYLSFYTTSKSHSDRCLCAALARAHTHTHIFSAYLIFYFIFVLLLLFRLFFCNFRLNSHCKSFGLIFNSFSLVFFRQ